MAYVRTGRTAGGWCAHRTQRRCWCCVLMPTMRWHCCVYKMCFASSCLRSTRSWRCRSRPFLAPDLVPRLRPFAQFSVVCQFVAEFLRDVGLFLFLVSNVGFLYFDVLPQRFDL